MSRHPWKVWGEILERRGKGKKEEGIGEKRRKGKRKAKEKWRGKIVKGEEENLKWKAERYENEQAEDFFFRLSLFETAEIVSPAVSSVNLVLVHYSLFFYGFGFFRPSISTS